MSCTSAKRPDMLADTASRNCFKRNSILWKSGMISPSCSGTSASMAWNSPNFSPARWEDSGVTVSNVCERGINIEIRQ